MSTVGFIPGSLLRASWALGMLGMLEGDWRTGLDKELNMTSPGAGQWVGVGGASMSSLGFLSLW